MGELTLGHAGVYPSHAYLLGGKHLTELYHKW
jgi:hypothetical protein